jgi:hypothetical protein
MLEEIRGQEAELEQVCRNPYFRESIESKKALLYAA